jgi:putative two-component system response regulator
MQKLTNAKILIVDDIPSNVLMLENILANAGYTDVQTTTDPLIVRALHERERFDLILLDIRMPKLDGFGVMRQLKELQTPEDEDYLPILVLTAQSDAQTRSRALRAGAKDFVTKPIEMEEVLSRVSNMLEVRLLYNQKWQQNEILEQKVRDRTQMLRETNLQIVRYLGRAAEYRDTETGMHVIRMSTMCACLGQTVGMGRTECELLLSASALHDLGKIGIPDRILLKSGPLDQEEWEVMKSHTQIGAEILSGHKSDVLEMASVIAITHHEWWDGTGYPNGLKNDEIPLVGRISTICDVFDALTSDRPYKKAWSIEKAVEFVNSSSGSQFDPDLVNLFVDTLPEVLSIRENYPDPDEHLDAVQKSAFAPGKAWVFPWSRKSSKDDKNSGKGIGSTALDLDDEVAELRSIDARR